VYANGDIAFAFQTTDPDAPYQTYNGFDLAFHEYGVNVDSAPEPASLVLLATGLVGVVAASRRKRA
jgi:hypothetical protein